MNQYLSRQSNPKVQQSKNRYGTYETPLGCEILNADNYPEAVNQYLTREKEVLRDVIVQYDAIIEAGCFDGRFLRWSFNEKVRYIGVDVVADFIIEAQHRAKFFNVNTAFFEFHLLDLLRISELSTYSDICMNGSKVLLFCPFNIIGNIHPICDLLEELYSCSFDVFLSCFNPGPVATAVRGQYYENCKYQDLQTIDELEGLRFVGSDQLDTIAYRPEWLLDKFSSLNTSHYRLSEVGYGLHIRKNTTK